MILKNQWFRHNTLMAIAMGKMREEGVGQRLLI